MSVYPIPEEPTRFWVTSGSRYDMLHIVDTFWQENPHDKPKPFCSCEESMAKGKVCKHIVAVAKYLHETTQSNP